MRTSLFSSLLLLGPTLIQANPVPKPDYILEQDPKTFQEVPLPNGGNHEAYKTATGLDKFMNPGPWDRKPYRKRVRRGAADIEEESPIWDEWGLCYRPGYHMHGFPRNCQRLAFMGCYRAIECK